MNLEWNWNKAFEFNNPKLYQRRWEKGGDIQNDDQNISFFLRWVCVHWAERNLLMCIPGAEYESKNTTLPLSNSQVYLKHGIMMIEQALNHSKCCIQGAIYSFIYLLINFVWHHTSLDFVHTRCTCFNNQRGMKCHVMEQ